jgi:hypothetical protein
VTHPIARGIEPLSNRARKGAVAAHTTSSVAAGRMTARPGATTSFTGIIFGYIVREFTDRFRIHLTVLLGYLLAVMTFHRVVPGGYPEWFCSLATPCYCLGHWLYHQSQQVIITPESS